MKKAEIVHTERAGSLRIEIRRYSDGRFGFEWKGDSANDRKQVRLKSLAAAKAKAKELVTSSKAGTVDLLRIDPDEYAEFLRWKAQRKTGKPVPILVKRFLDAKEKKGRSAKHMQGLRHTLNAFAAAFPCTVDKLNRLGVEAWLDGKARRDGRKIGARRWNNCLKDVISLLLFAKRDGALADEKHPVELIERKTVVVTVKTFSPEELSKILAVVEPDWLPVIALGAFCGLRPEEICPEGRNEKSGIEWRNINWERGKVDVPAHVSKTRRRRFAVLTDAAAAFLAPYRNSVGSVAPTDRRFCHYLPRLTRLSGVAWRADALRHSFASYRLALTKDLPALALELGNSPDMIYRHYLDLKHEDEALRWFGLRPQEAGKVVPFAVA